MGKLNILIVVAVLTIVTGCSYFGDDSDEGQTDLPVPQTEESTQSELQKDNVEGNNADELAMGSSDEIIIIEDTTNPAAIPPEQAVVHISEPTAPEPEPTAPEPEPTVPEPEPTAPEPEPTVPAPSVPKEPTPVEPPSSVYGDVINVRSLGAIGNGYDDDTYAFQLAMNEASLYGKNVFVPAGTYIVTESIFITGSNYDVEFENGVIIKSVFLRQRPIFYVSSATNIHMSGSAVLMSDFSGDAFDKTHGIVMFEYSNSCSIDGMTLKDSNHLAVLMLDSSGVVVSNNTVYNEYGAIHDVRGNSNSIINNQVIRSGNAADVTQHTGRDRGIRASESIDLLIEGNYITNFSLALELYSDTDRVNIKNNTIVNTGFAMSLDRGHNSVVSENNISLSTTAIGLQIGIELAESNNVMITGNTIQITNGYYTGNGIAVWKADTGSGEASRGAQITNNTISGVAHGIALSGASDCVVDGNTITDTVYGVEMAEYNASNIVIQNNTLLNQHASAIRLPGNRGYNNVTIANNYIENSGYVGIMLSQAINVSTGNIDDPNDGLSVIGNHIVAPKQRGILAIFANGSIIDNTIEWSGKSGIYFFGAEVYGHVVINNNYVKNCYTVPDASEAGIYVIDIRPNMTVTVQGNSIEGTVNGEDLVFYKVTGTIIQ